MKFKRISQERAEKIIVYGKGAGFSIVKLAGTNYTIYHRVFENKFYNIAQMSIYDEENDKTIYVFYIFDNEDVKTILSVDPEEDIRKELSGEVIYNG